MAVHLSRTGIGDDTMTALSRLDSLMTVEVRNAQVSDASLSGFRGLRLQSLVLDGTRITDAAIPQLGRQPDLVSLHLHGTKITDATLASLTKASFPRLVSLEVRETNATSRGIGSLSLPALIVLSCDGPLTPADWRRLRTLRKLEIINCDGTNYERFSGRRFGARFSRGPFARLDSRRRVIIPEKEE